MSKFEAGTEWGNNVRMVWSGMVAIGEEVKKQVLDIVGMFTRFGERFAESLKPGNAGFETIKKTIQDVKDWMDEFSNSPAFKMMQEAFSRMLEGIKNFFSVAGPIIKVVIGLVLSFIGAIGGSIILGFLKGLVQGVIGLFQGVMIFLAGVSGLS